jgi:glycosyltransferase involved in cell wall biosynthesis
MSLPSSAELASLHQHVPELARGWQEFRPSSYEHFEMLCTARIDGSNRPAVPSILIDVRNVGPFYNGTVQSILEFATALRQLRSSWSVSLLATAAGEAFHDLARKYKPWAVHTEVPTDRAYSATLRPSQPWHISEMIDLHRLSLVNAYSVLDTINWDIVYSAPSHLEGTWQFLASHADALLFDSEFTRQRFVQRFPGGAHVPAVVTYFSFDPDEYVHTDVSTPAPGPAEEFVLVIGNGLDHKDVRATVEALASAFPFRKITAVGPANVHSPYVTVLPSGTLSDREVHALYASARYVVCPSFYEGFGFPMVTALAYGRTVLARRSALVDEIAARCSPRGRLITFNRRDELVELLGRLIHGEPVTDCPLGSALVNSPPSGWRDVARSTLEFLESITRTSAPSRWLERERVVEQLIAYRT